MKLISLETILRRLKDENARYLIVGGLAVAAHGYGRVTFDLDLVVQLQADNVKRVIKALESLGYRPTVPVSIEDFSDKKKRQRWFRDKGMVVFPLQSNNHPETPVDLFIAEPFDFDMEYDKAMIGEVLPGLKSHFVAMDTLIRMKEVSDREKDREDIRQLKLLKEDG